MILSTLSTVRLREPFGDLLMKKSIVMMIALTMVASTLHAQEEIIPPPRSRGAKVGALLGFTAGYLFMDTKPINDFLKMGNAAPVNTGGVFLYGGAGAAYIMLVKNLRVGGIGMSGHSMSSAVDPVSGIRRDAKLTAGYGAVTFEYVVPIVERLDFVGGLDLGWGGIDIELRKSSGGSTTWEQEQNAFGSQTLSTTSNLTRTLSGNFFVWTPSVSLEYAMLGWLGIRVGASYLGMSAPSWQVDNNYDLVGVPSNVTGKGWMVNGGVFLGTF
jgi:hypothetical protein